MSRNVLVIAGRRLTVEIIRLTANVLCCISHGIITVPAKLIEYLIEAISSMLSLHVSLSFAADAYSAHLNDRHEH